MAGLNREYFNCVQLNITNLVNILYTMTQTYRLLVGGAEEFARIGLAPKHDKEEAIDRADDMGDIIDKVIKKLDCQTSIFLQLFEPEIICALPRAPETCPKPKPCPTTTPCPTEAPTPTAPPRTKQTLSVDAVIGFIPLQGVIEKPLDSRKDLVNRNENNVSRTEEEKDEDNQFL